MKKITYSLFLFAATAMLLASCSTQLSNVSVTKRHYRSGYYVDMGNAKHKTEIASQKTIVPAIETVPVSQVKEANNVSESTPIITTTASGTIASKKNKQDIPKELIASSHKHSASGSLTQLPVPNTVKELKNIQVISNILSESKSNDHNHSLLWTIIVILLILWLISFLMGGWGLGGLLNLLLVIALILIILSLLGII